MSGVPGKPSSFQFAPSRCTTRIPDTPLRARSVRLEGGGDLWQPGSNDTAKANMNKYGQR